MCVCVCVCVCVRIMLLFGIQRMCAVLHFQNDLLVAWGECAVCVTALLLFVACSQVLAQVCIWACVMWTEAWMLDLLCCAY